MCAILYDALFQSAAYIGGTDFGKHEISVQLQAGKAKIVNYTSAQLRRVDINVTAAYESPTASVKAALADAVASTPGFLAEPAPFINILSYKDSAVEYTVRAWVNTPDYWTAYYALLENIGVSFAKFGVEMTYNHLNVHIMEK